MPNNIRDQAKIVTFGSMKDFHKGEIQNNHAFIYLFKTPNLIEPIVN